MSLVTLTQRIIAADEGLRVEAGKAVNMLLTIRNWFIGFCLVHYEQNGEERAQYGEGLVDSVAKNLTATGMSARNLRLYRRFFLVYIHMAPAVHDFLTKKIWQSPIAKFDSADLQRIGDLSLDFKLLEKSLILPPEKLLLNLSFTHFTLLLVLSDSFKRTFYEVEAISGTWSVSELKRQINSLLFERSAMSRDPKLLLAATQGDPIKQEPRAFVRDVYTFEFLGLPEKEAVTESKLENMLLDHIQEFILELGNGFCFEARQRRILIGGEYFFVDMVFYNRLLKCHVLLELKIDAFNSANAGQLNTYLNYFKMEVQAPDDNPPIGILLVAHKNDALVQYATAGLDRNLFVSKYMLQLPDTKHLEALLKTEMANMDVFRNGSGSKRFDSSPDVEGKGESEDRENKPIHEYVV